MKKLLVAFFVVCFVGHTQSHQLYAGTLKAGVARLDLTPPLEMKSPLGGYGARMNAPAEGVHALDRRHAR